VRRQLGHFLGRITSTIVRLSPFGRWTRKPEPIPESAGMVVSSAYVKPDAAISASENVMYARSVSGCESGDSVPTTNPLAFVKLSRKPLNLAVLEPSADTKYAMSGTPSVTNLCNKSPASLAEIMLSLMAEDFGKEAARCRCEQLRFL
jgi:hypothetical protein